MFERLFRFRIRAIKSESQAFPNSFGGSLVKTKSGVARDASTVKEFADESE